MSPRVAVIGAGLSGLGCASRLADAGLDVQLLDKGNRPGGRATTRLHAGPFDHGAQFFTAQAPDFRETVQEWRDAGWVAPWNGRHGTLAGGILRPESPEEPRWVGVPTMGALPEALARGLAIHHAVRVVTLAGDPGAWWLVDEAGGQRGPFDVVVVSCPPVQALPLLAASPPLADAARRAELAPCWAAMLRFAGPLALSLDAARVLDEEIGWLARDSSKPGRPSVERWVVHATSDFSRAELERERVDVEARLLAAFRRVTGCDDEPVELRAHRWRYARVERAVGEPCGWDGALGLGACGDWWIEARLEAAWTSGRALAERILHERG